MSESENETVNAPAEEQQSSGEQMLPERPGRRLREAREARNLSRENVASELRLQTRVVAALEEDDNDSLPPPAFAIGYLRNYARRLDLPADEIVRAYEQNLEGSQPEIVSRVRKSQVSSRDLPVRMVTWLIFIGLAALLVVWWLAQQPVPAPSSEQTGTSPETATAIPGSTSMIPEPDVQSMPEQRGPDIETAPEPSDFVAEPQDRASEDTEPEERLSEESTTQVQPRENRQTQNAFQQETTGTILQMKFEADSWTQVTDADGEQLVSGVVKAGRTLRFEGKAPYRVIVGYAPGVTVHYQGERFDHTPYMRGNVARFNIGSPEDVPGGEG